jgi:hypothetical protein
LRRPLFSTFAGRNGAALALLALALTGPTPAAAIDSRLGEGVPLVLKDGRIATVSVHTIPFETGADELEPAAASALRQLVEPMATDCFLTAQAIGHVEPGLARDGDTLSAHRLARERADNIQASLAELGMPKAAVASVWDWQFLLPRSEVTLWVFSLTVGDDCDGTPLERGEAIAAAARPETVAAPTVTATETPQPPAETAAAPIAPPRDLQVGEVEGDGETSTRMAAQAAADAATAAPSPVAQPTDTVAAAPDATASDEAAATTPTAQLAEPATLTTRTDDPLATAAVAPAESPAPLTAPAAEPAPATQLAAAPATTDTPTAATNEPSLTIAFDVNSSFFPSGANRELSAFMDGLPADAALEIELAGAVGTGSVRGADPEEAARYNAWMAERRIERIAEWLEAHAGGRELTLKPRLVDNDPSREVRLRAVALR